MHHNSFSYSLIDGHSFVCSPFAIINTASVSITIHMSLHSDAFISVRQIPRSGFIRLEDIVLFSNRYR